MIRKIYNDKLKIFNGEFEFIDSGFSDGQYNMDFDILRTREFSNGTELPMFRFYGWKPWAVSLGANQNDSDIDSLTCKSKGYDVVRRPTGGRAVLHANELTYSVVTTLNDELTVHSIYREIHDILLTAFKSLGCRELEFEKSQADFRNLYKDSDMSVSCFASSARYEISFKGRKVVGSAQRLFGKTLLQHGSVLLGKGHEEIASVVNVIDESKKSVLRENILSHSSTLEEASGRKIGYKECLDAIYSVLIK